MNSKIGAHMMITMNESRALEALAEFLMEYEFVDEIDGTTWLMIPSHILKEMHDSINEE